MPDTLPAKSDAATLPDPSAGHGYGAELIPGERSPAAYAASRARSRGRLYPEPPCPTRNDLQRDRDRVLHSSAFRRLTYKTQMFVYHEGDHYRTRLTHSLEVAQIARTIARQLRLDEDLAEALALAHDLGHPPFGHAGERALDALLEPHGGFDHNVQSVRVVTRLEGKYASFDGLNLAWETLEGLVKHNGPPIVAGKVRDARLVHAVRHIDAAFPLDLDRQPSAEAQVAAIADDIAWMTHDIDDGLRAGLIETADLAEVALVSSRLAPASAFGPDDAARRIYDVVRRLITDLVADVVGETRRQLGLLAPKLPDDIRRAGRPIVAFSTPMGAELGLLRRFLFARLYRHPRVNRVMGAAQDVIRDLVGRYLADAKALPEHWQPETLRLDEHRRARRIADFVAGQTDRYALAEHRRLFATTPELR